MSSRFLTTHNSWDKNLVLPFAVTPFNRREIYVDPVWGVKVVRVTADRQTVQPQEYDVDLDDVSFATIDIGDSTFVYRVRFADFFVARTLTESDWTFERYELPRDAPRISIEYQLREPGGGLGPSLTLESRLK